MYLCSSVFFSKKNKTAQQSSQAVFLSLFFDSELFAKMNCF